jgi:hypothetical protein
VAAVFTAAIEKAIAVPTWWVDVSFCIFVLLLEDTASNPGRRAGVFLSL